MNTLKVKAVIYCDTCGDKIKRTKQIKVKSTNEQDAKSEANEKIQAWKLSLSNQDCAFCKKIKKDLAE